MPAEITRTITACCWNSGAEMKIKIDPSTVIAELMTRIEKGLAKKGVGVQWIEKPADAELFVRIIKIDQGNQFWRYVFPFLAPATLAVEGRFALEGGYPENFGFNQKAQIGLFGGSAGGMLKVCAQVTAKRIVKGTLKAM